jgi:hypothetical protein
MNRYCSLILVAFLCAALAIAGCTTPAGTPAPATPAPAATPASLALTPSDVPAGYVLTESRQKNATDVSKLAISLGWQAGYAVLYTNSSAPPGSRDIIVQTITTYSESNIPDIVKLVNQQDRSFSDMTFTDLQVSGLGANSGGFVGIIQSSEPVVLAAETTSALSSVSLTGSTSMAVSGQNFAEVYFAKGSTFEVIRMTGPHASGEAVTALARTACEKIP